MLHYDEWQEVKEMIKRECDSVGFGMTILVFILFIAYASLDHPYWLAHLWAYLFH